MFKYRTSMLLKILLFHNKKMPTLPRLETPEWRYKVCKVTCGIFAIIIYSIYMNVSISSKPSYFIP